jgi:prophage DNA circulation protein
MGWEAKLQKASFRGVPFKVDTADTGLGRNVAMHRYPNRDFASSEDLGRKGRSFTINAYVAGDDFFPDRDRLLEAIEGKSGAGTLIHPTLGSIQAVVLSATHRYKGNEGGVEYIEITFEQVGEFSSQAATTNATAALALVATSAASQAQTSFNGGFNTIAQPAFVANSAIATNSSFLSIVKGGLPWANMALNRANVVLSAINNLGNPLALFGQAGGYSGGVLGLFSAVRVTLGTAKARYDYFSSFLNFNKSETSLSTDTPQRQQLAANNATQTQLVRVLAVSEVAQAAPELPLGSQQDASGIRDKVLAQLDSEINEAALMGDDELMGKLEQLAASFSLAMQERLLELDKLIELTLKTSQPALVLAWELYENPARGAEIVARNNQRHPGFLQANQPLQVLSA